MQNNYVMSKIKEYKVGELVELTSQLRKPRLKGIIIERLGFDKNLDDFIYLIFCFSFKPPKKLTWKHNSIRKIS